EFPILELPAELSYNILSYMDKEELSVCLQSLVLDKVHAEWSKDKRVEDVTIKFKTYDDKTINTSSRYAYRDISSPLRRICDRFREVYSKCEFDYLEIYLHKNYNVTYCRELIEQCMGIRCTDLLRISLSLKSCSKVLSDEFLRKLTLEKNEVIIPMLCEVVTAAGLLVMWEDLLDGKFDCLSIVVNKVVVTELFDLIRTDGEKSSWESN
ncbi:hypothetical protein PFISCL1PPCAC_21863, partial [Pristionchus fissidentatus]